MLFLPYPCLGQPKQDSKRIIENVVIYQDAKDPLLYYYEPGKLTLATDGTGKPEFQFLDLRYTGNKCNADIGTKNYSSLVQFGVEMEKLAPQTRKLIIKELGRCQLKPLPLSHIATRLILPKTSDENGSKPIGSENSTQAEDKNGYNSNTAYWSKRYFTTRLTKFESQLLNEQLTNGTLGISLSYSYYSTMLPASSEEVSGSKEFTGITEAPEAKENEQELTNVLINSDAITIDIDLEKYPEAIKQVDLNEGIPPSYAALEIKCYDFSQNLRPDLYLKTVEIEAVSVNANKPVSVIIRFTQKDVDIHTRYMNFPYAVQVSKPMRYRISEISNKGTREVYEWIDKPDCTSIIDITTPIKDLKTELFTLDIEVNDALLSENNKASLIVELSFLLNGKTTREVITFTKEDALLKTLAFEKDKDATVTFKTRVQDQDETILESEEQLVTDTYLYINSI
ncbi:hypothetical protein ACJD0Z_01915 [Flavobacteriaceae bacterium M23B6Z8]